MGAYKSGRVVKRRTVRKRVAFSKAELTAYRRTPYSPPGSVASTTPRLRDVRSTPSCKLARMSAVQSRALLTKHGFKPAYVQITRSGLFQHCIDKLGQGNFIDSLAVTDNPDLDGACYISQKGGEFY